MRFSNETTLGIILAAGKSTRLYPATLATTKQLVPVYDKPLIYYPLTTLMLAGIRDVLFITNPGEFDLFTRLLGTGEDFGMNFEFTTQARPNGIAEALTLTDTWLRTASKFDGKRFQSLFLILGDNLFHGAGLSQTFRTSINDCNLYARAQTFFQRVKDPQRFGVGVWDDIGKLISIEEKPAHPKSNFISVGGYIYPMNTWNDGFLMAKELKLSGRGEYEITDLNNMYIAQEKMTGVKLPRAVSWFDCGTYDSLLEAAMFVKTVQDHQGFLVGSPHEVAFAQGRIGSSAINDYTCKTGGPTKNAYNEYLTDMVLSEQRSTTSTR